MRAIYFFFNRPESPAPLTHSPMGRGASTEPPFAGLCTLSPRSTMQVGGLQRLIDGMLALRAAWDASRFVK